MNPTRKLLLIALAAMATVSAAQEQPPAPATPEQRVAMLKQWLQASQAQLRKYEWVETTVITKDSEEKSRQQNTVYYGADGKLQRGRPPAGPKPSPAVPLACCHRADC